MEKYFGDWTNINDVKRDFFRDGSAFEWEQKNEVPADFPSDEEVLFACYTYEDYSGSAMVVYQKGDKLFEVHGSHCSCYGLEGQWSPEETLAGALEMRTYLSSSFPSDAADAFRSRWPEKK